MSGKNLAAQELHGGWQLESPEADRWLAATVPGCIHTDLHRHGLIPDPFHGRNELDLQWIGERDWIYRTTFAVDASLEGHDEIDLVFEGLDTVATVRLNGEVILESENMYHSHRIPVRERLRPGGNDLEIRFASAVHYTQTHRIDFTPPRSFNDPGGSCVRIRKQPCQFGWDWGPRFVTAGVWRPVRLEAWSGNRIESVKIVQHHGPDGVRLDLTPELARGEAAAKFHVTVSLGDDLVATGEALDVMISKPEIWWPAGQGDQSLYDVKVELIGDGVAISTWNGRIGLRTITLDREFDEFEVEVGGRRLGRFGLRVNGRLIFAKGANWIPAHSFVHGLGRADYEPLLRSAVDANMNTLRVWGGGIYEYESFYDLCDELGLLVWQDFMFACDLYPSDQAFLDSVRTEAEQTVRRLRHRASLALWCGNNEAVMLNAEHLQPGGAFYDGYVAIFHRLLPGVVEELDGATPFVPSSPDRPLPGESEHVPPSQDEHDWHVWHERFPVEHYETTRHRFASEFGMQSYSSPEIAATFCPEEELNIFSPIFENHQKNVGGNQVIFDYVSRLFRFPKDYRSVAYLSQLNQAFCMQTAVEHWRRISPLCLGALYWQLNDCWPVASWSSLEFGGKWKALHHYARRFFAPELVSFRHLGRENRITGNYVRSDTGVVKIHALQDGPAPQSFVLRWRLLHLDGSVTEERSISVDLEPQRGVLVESVDLTSAVERVGRDRVFLRAELIAADGSERARNFTFFTAPRNLSLSRQPIRTVWARVAESEWTLTLASDAFHYAVNLELEGLTPWWSDNFFHLPAGETVVVTVRFSAAVDENLLGALRVFSLVDSYA